MVKLNHSWYVPCAFLGDKANIEFWEQFLTFLAKSDFLVEDELAFLVGRDFVGKGSSCLFDGHFAREFYFHFDGDDGYGEGENLVLIFFGHIPFEIWTFDFIY